MSARLALRTIAVLIAVGVLGVLASPALGAPRTFEERFSTNDTGDVAMVGNTLLTCSVMLDALCPGAQAGTVSGSALNNNAYQMQYVNQDLGGGRFNSSSANLELPPGATVLRAMLYFGGDSTAGTGGAPPPDAAARDTAQLRVPGAASYQPLVASQLDFTTTSGSDFQGVVDVTDQVGAAGSGTYWVGDVQVGTGPDRQAGWSLVVAYRDSAQPPRNLTIFDGFQVVNSGQPNVSIGVAGFQTPPTGPVRTRLGFVAYEGDAGSTGDSAKLNTTTLSDATSPARNFFNSSISIDGAPFTAKDPNFVNQLGFDAKQVGADGVLANGDTSAVIRLTTGGETYFPGAVTFATELFSPDVQLTKAVQDLNGGSVQPGDVLRYSVTAVNAGPDDATNVVLSDPIPTNATFAPGSLTVDGVPMDDGFPGADQAGFDAPNDRAVFWIGTGASGGVGGTLAGGGATSTVTFDVTVSDAPPGTEITNVGHADFFARTLGAPLSADSNAVTSTIASPDLTVVKTPTNFVAVVGTPQTFTLTVTNSGTAPTDGSQVTVTDAFPLAPPAAFDQIDPSGDGWTCTPGPFPAATPVTVSCQRTAPSVLAPGDSYPPITIDTLVDNDPPGNIANTANVAGGGDGDTTNNSSTNIGQTTERADLQLLKTADRSTALTGEQVTFTLRVRNGGPSPAQNVSVDDSSIVGDYSVDSASASQGSCTTAVVCDLGTLEEGGEAIVTIRATVTATGAAVVQAQNTATVSSDATDPDPTNDQSTATVDVPPTADLSIAKSSAPTPLDSTLPAQYTLTVDNDGPQTATNVVVTEPLPAGFDFTSAVPSVGACDPVVDNVLRCALGAMANGATATIEVDGTLDDSTAGTFLSNSAVVGADTGDPDPLDNSATSSSVVIPAADLQLTKLASNETPNPGDEVAFTLVADNLGPSVAQNVQVTDALPAGLTLVSAPGCTPSGGTVSCSVASLAPGASQSFELRARVDGAAAGQQIENTANATSDTPDPIPPNGTDNATLSVATQAQPPPLPPSFPAFADLALTKRAVGRPVVGRRLRYRLTVRNDGPQAANDVVVTDTLPSRLRFVSATASQGSCTGTRAIRCGAGSLASGASATITLTVIPRSTGSVRNSATAGSSTPDPNAANNTTRVRSTVRPRPTRLVVRKRVDRATVTAGGTLRYTITARVAGPGAARNVRVCDRLPGALSFASAPGARLRRGQACWTRSRVAAGKTLRFHLTARVHRTARGGRVTNTAVANAANARALARGRAQVRVRATQQPGGGVTG